MKRLVVIILFLFVAPTYSQWEMISSPLATPDIQKVASHPDGFIIAITSENEVYKSHLNKGNWEKVAVINTRVFSLAIDQQGKIYLGVSAGFMTSIDSGVSWVSKILTSNASHISDFVFKSNGYVVLTEYSQYITEYRRVWISSNGINWTYSANGLNGSSPMVIEKDTEENLFLLTVNGVIFKSTDNGYQWQNLSTLEPYAYDLQCDSSNNLYAATINHIYKSTDSGISWSTVRDESTSRIFIDQNNTIYSLHLDYLSYSEDEGITWSNLGLTGTRIYDIVVTSDSIYVATGLSSGSTHLISKGLQFSDDRGINWKVCFRYTDRFVKINDLIISENRIYATGTVGLYKSNATNNWDTVLTYNMNLIKKNKQDILYTTSNLGILYRSTDEGVSWTECLNSVRNFYINDSNYIFATRYSTVFKSTDHGFSWTMIYPGSPNVSEIYGITQNLSGSIFISTFHRFYVPGYGYIYTTLLMRTDDDGTTWSEVRNDRLYSNIYFFDSTMYLISSNGIFKSTNNGVTVMPINNGLTNLNVSKMLITPSGVLICVTGNGIHSSLANGNYWVRLDHTGLLSSKVNGIFYSENGVLYSCTDNGIGKFVEALPVELTSFTASISLSKVQLNWQTATELNNQGFEIQRKIENSDWFTIGFRTGKGTTTEPTSYFFEDDISEINSDKLPYRLKQIDFNGAFSFSNEVEVITQPYDFSLSQNYPNPFNPVTIIKYEIPKNSNVKLEIFDVLGRKVTTVVNEEKQPGRYKEGFDASVLASGIYYYRIVAEGFTSTKKMLLLK